MQPSVEDTFMAVLLTLSTRMRQRLPGDELDHSLMPVLRVLADFGPVRHTTLVDRLALDASTVSRKVRHLEERGLVRVAADPSDARARRVELLPAGRRALDHLLANRRALLSQVLDGWPARDRDRLAALLERLHAELLADAPPTRALQEARS